MTTDKFLAKIKDTVSSFSPLAIYHEGADDCLFLMKDDNNICYVFSGDLVYSMMYDFVLSSGEICCQVSDSPIARRTPSFIDIVEVKPYALLNAGLFQAQMDWLRSDSIKSMVRSVQSAMEE